MKYYKGPRYHYHKEFKEKDWVVEDILFEWFVEYNETVFDNELVMPNYLIFFDAHWSKSKRKFHGGYFSPLYFRLGIEKSQLRYGIGISIQLFLTDPEEAKNIFLHELVHLYCWQNNLSHKDKTIDFVYHCGWFRAPLHWYCQNNWKAQKEKGEIERKKLQTYSHNLEDFDLEKLSLAMLG